MTKEIQLTKGYVALVDDEDYEYLKQWNWHVLEKKNGVYAVRKERGFPFQKSVLMHRVITNAPKGMEVDHRDSNGLNNTRANLRICTHLDNNRNKRRIPRNKSGYKGVYRNGTSKKWLAQIGVKNQMIYLGSFNTPEEAAHAYDKAAMRYFGEYARTNFQNGNRSQR